VHGKWPPHAPPLPPPPPPRAPHALRPVTAHTRRRRTLIKLRATHMASCSDRLASSMIILLPPRTNTVTALELAHSSITSMWSLVVPNPISRTFPAWPSLADDSSENRGTMRPPVAMAISSSSTPPTHRTAGKPFCSL
jgi:hypothetical protein